MIEEEVKARSVQARQFQTEALPCEGGDRSVQIETLEAVCRGQERVDPTSGETAAHDRQQATAPVVLGPPAPLPVAGLPGAGYARLELRSARGLEPGAALRLFFGGERRGALGLAGKRYRTSLCTVL